MRVLILAATALVISAASASANGYRHHSLWSVAAIEQQARLTYDPWEDEVRAKLARLCEDKVKDGMYEVGVNRDGHREWRVASSYLLGTCGLNLQSNVKPTPPPNALRR